MGVSTGKSGLQFLSQSNDHLLQLLLLTGGYLADFLLIPGMANLFQLQLVPKRLNGLAKFHDLGMGRRDYLLDGLLLIRAGRFQFGPHRDDRPSELYNLVAGPDFLVI